MTESDLPVTASSAVKASSVQSLVSRRWRAVVRRADTEASGSGVTSSVVGGLAIDRREAYSYFEGLDPKAMEAGLAAYVAPYLRQAACALTRLGREAQSKNIPEAVHIGLQALTAFRERLLQSADQTAALLLNVAKVKGQIAGATPADRLARFADLATTPEYRAACQARFPILDGILHSMTEDAVAFWAEFLVRLCADRPLLKSITPGGLGEIKVAKFYAGDPHNYGRSVVLLHGTEGAVVYKPRALDADEAFGRAVAWINEKIGLGLSHVRVVNRFEYGWSEFIGASDCQGQSEVTACFERCGGLTALLYLLGGSDLHHENIICRGDEPYVVDVEAILNGPQVGNSRYEKRRQLAKIESVLNLCYFPSLIPMGSSFVDITGAGFSGEQEIEFKSAIRTSEENDACGVPIKHVMPPTFNLPRLSGVPQKAYDNLAAIERGFRATLEAVIAHRREFFGREDLMPSFANVNSRFIPRGTAQYAQIMRNALHPHACVSREKHDLALAGLVKRGGWPERPLRELLVADVVAVRRGDVPFFKTTASSRHIFTSSGAPIQDVFQLSGFEAAALRIAKLDERDISAQIASMRLAFGAVAAKPGIVSRRSGIRSESAGMIESQRLAVARAIGNRLLDQAIVAKDHIFWMGRLPVEGGFSTQMLESELYGGTAGIGIFLAELSRITRSPRFRLGAQKCLNTLRSGQPMPPSRIGAFEGISGSIYADLKITSALGRSHWDKLPFLLTRVAENVAADTMLDIIAGTAGALIVSLRARKAPALAAAAENLSHLCATHLLDRAESNGDGLAWKTPLSGAALTGLAHGSCGIAWALAEYAAVFDDGKAWEAARKGFNYARASAQEPGIWEDLRGDGGHMMAWCHGTAGIVLARQRALELAPHRFGDVFADDIANGLQALLEKTGPGADGLCHGRSGNWEALWRGEAEHRAIADLEVASLCKDWLAGISPAGELGESTPDLMNGLAGVGLQILRSVDRSVPCVALLD